MNKVLLAIMDGIGISDKKVGNAVKLAKPKFLNKALKKFPSALLHASSEYVGLPAGQIGNSEVGHQNIGAGRVALQELLTINSAINDGSFYKNQVLLNTINEAKTKRKALHIVGIASNGGVHGSLQHIIAVLQMAKSCGIKRVFIHAITDGRDTLPSISDNFIKELLSAIESLKIGKLATIVGRYYAMDRESHFDRTNIAYQAIVKGTGQKTDDMLKTLKGKLSLGETDEFIKPLVNSEYGGFKRGDYVIFTNFRADRARQLSYALVDSKFDKFPTDATYNLTTMTSYSAELDAMGVECAFKQKLIKNNLTEVVTKAGGKVLKIAETTKYAHVTYFFNGLREKPYKNEERILHNSDNVATFDLKPQMQAEKIADSAVQAMQQAKFDLIVLNFANGDMVGHTGNLKATEIAVKTVDKALQKLYKNKNGYTILITADHGNAECMVDENGQVITAHTLNPVPFIVCDKSVKFNDGDFALSNIAPTILDIMGIQKPKEMTCQSIIKH